MSSSSDSPPPSPPRKRQRGPPNSIRWVHLRVNSQNEVVSRKEYVQRTRVRCSSAASGCVASVVADLSPPIHRVADPISPSHVSGPSDVLPSSPASSDGGLDVVAGETQLEPPVVLSPAVDAPSSPSREEIPTTTTIDHIAIRQLQQQHMSALKALPDDTYWLVCSALGLSPASSEPPSEPALPAAAPVPPPAPRLDRSPTPVATTALGIDCTIDEALVRVATDAARLPLSAASQADRRVAISAVLCGLGYRVYSDMFLHGSVAHISSHAFRQVQQETWAAVEAMTTAKLAESTASAKSSPRLLAPSMLAGRSAVMRNVAPWCASTCWTDAYSTSNRSCARVLTRTQRGNRANSNPKILLAYVRASTKLLFTLMALPSDRA